MPVPQACQQLADEVARLEEAEAALRDKLPALSGVELWSTLRDLGRTRSLRQDANRQLQICLAENTTSLQVTVSVMDVSGLPPSATQRRAHLWDPGRPAAPIESRVVVADAVSFTGTLGDRFQLGLTTGDGNAAGTEFRSLPLEKPADEKPVRIEMVVAPPIRFDPLELSHWWTRFSPPELTVTTAAGSATASVSSADARLEADTVRVGIKGELTFTSSIGGIIERSRYAAEVGIHVVPSSALDPRRLCEIMLEDFRFVDSGYVGGLSNMLLPLVRDAIEASLEPEIGALVNRELAESVATMFALRSVPEGATISIRQVTLSEEALTVLAVVGAIGDLLSTLKPDI